MVEKPIGEVGVNSMKLGWLKCNHVHSSVVVDMQHHRFKRIKQEGYDRSTRIDGHLAGNGVPKNSVASQLVPTDIIAAQCPYIRFVIWIRIKRCLPFTYQRSVKPRSVQGSKSVRHFVRESCWKWRLPIPSNHCHASLGEQRVSYNRCSTMGLKKTRNLLDGIIELFAAQLEPQASLPGDKARRPQARP